MIYDNLRIVAAGRGRSMNMPPIMNAVLDLVPRKQQSDINMVYLGTASYDKSDVFHAQTSEYQKIANCRLTKLDVSEAVEQIPSEYVIRSMLLSADVIMVSGGNTLYAMNRWKELKIDAIIKEAVDSSSPVLCGGSAGAICWFQYGHSDSMDPTTFLQVDPNLTKEQKEGWEYICVEGLGLLPFLCVPHHDATQSNGLPRSQDSDAMLLRMPATPGMCIDEKAALVVVNGKARTISADDMATCTIKHVVGLDHPSIEARPLSEDMGFIPIENLLSARF